MSGNPQDAMMGSCLYAMPHGQTALIVTVRYQKELIFKIDSSLRMSHKG